MFKKFVHNWNSGRLDKKFYDGLPPETLEESRSFTAHKWGFAKKLSSYDAATLASAKDSVHVSTHRDDSKKRARDGDAKPQWSAAGTHRRLLQI